MNILVTGTAGFIGFHLAKRLLEEGHAVVGIDSINDYYDVALKLNRLKACGIAPEGGRSSIYDKYVFHRMDLCDANALHVLMEEGQFDVVVNLAAQAGVRYSLTHPESYLQSNIVGFGHVLEACRQAKVPRLVYASSSSVYGDNASVPFKETDRVDYPVSLYAASKKSNELMAFSYARLYGLQTIGLRFFTVYGPWGRPDMAPMLFASAIREGRTIRVFNHGHLMRDFTYIDDIVEGIFRVVTVPGMRREDVPHVPATIYNIGHGSPVALMDFIQELERCMGREATKEFVDMQAGDVHQTWADTTRLQDDYHYTPVISLGEGIARFVEWFKTYYR